MSNSNEEKSAEAVTAAAAAVNEFDEDDVMSVQDLLKKLQLLHSGTDAEKASALDDFHLLLQDKISLSDVTSEWEACLSSFDEKSVLDVPFLSLPKVKAIQVEAASGVLAPRNTTMAKYMSRDTESVNRAPLKRAYRFNVAFKPYGDDKDWDVSTAPSFVGKPGPKKAQRALRFLLENTVVGYANTPDSKQKVQQLFGLSHSMSKIFSLFGYDLEVSSPPLDDFTFTFQSPAGSSEVTVMVGEGKDVATLPEDSLSSNLSHQLCSFGFATWLAAHYVVGEGLPNAKEMKSSQKMLETKLKLKASAKASNQHDKKQKQVKVKLAATEAGAYESALSKMKDNGDFDTIVESVLEALDAKVISPLDALQLWAAVLQACFATVHQRKRFTLVLSMKNMWFIKLCVLDEKCQACISDPVPVGSPGSNLILLSFLHMARTKGDIVDHDQKMWEHSLSTGGVEDDGAGEDGGDDGPALKGGGKSSSKKRKTNTPKKRSQSNKAAQAHDVASLIDQQPVAEQEFMSVSKHGVVVPYFHQIDGEMGELGIGRCGQVIKIKWRDGFAAKKEYLMDPEDDGRDGNEVFRHERHVYFQLHQLWGKHVPTLLFHKDWPRHPYLGLEVGEAMPHEWEDWSKEEEEQADEAIAAVRGEGWEHGDIKTHNFVRLTHADTTTSTSIALIDFEDAHYIGPSKSLFATHYGSGRANAAENLNR